MKGCKITFLDADGGAAQEEEGPARPASITHIREMCTHNLSYPVTSYRVRKQERPGLETLSNARFVMGAFGKISFA